MKLSFIVLLLILMNFDKIYSFEIIEKKFKNTIDLNYSSKSGGSYYDSDGKNQTELIRYIDSIRYTNGTLSPINYVFRRDDKIFDLGFKYFLNENIAIKGMVKSSYLSLEQREFFYLGIDEFQTNEKISYDLNEKNEFILNSYELGAEYFITKEKLISGVSFAYRFSGATDEVNYFVPPEDSLDPERAKTQIHSQDSIYIRNDGFDFEEPSVLDLGFVVGYQFKKVYLEFSNNYLVRSEEFKNLNISHIAAEMNANRVFKLKGRLVYQKVIGGEEDFGHYRPFRSNIQEENFYVNVGIVFLQKNYLLDVNYSQTLLANNSLNWGGVSVGFSYLFDF